MAKGFEIEYNGSTFNAEDYEKRHEVQKWDDEKPKANILTAANGDLDIISEGAQPEFEILFYRLSEAEYKSLLLLNSKITIFRTETDGDLSRIRNAYDNMFVSVKPVNIAEATAFPALQIKLKSTKAGAIIAGELIENALFVRVTDYAAPIKTHDDKIIIYRS